DILGVWLNRRNDVAARYPVLLQVYAGWRSMDDAGAATTDIGKQIARALLAVRDEAKRVDTQATTIWSGPSLRVVPVRQAGSGGYVIAADDLARPVTTGPYQSRKLGNLLNSDHVAAARTYGLTIPASEVGALMLQQDENLRDNTGWLHA